MYGSHQAKAGMTPPLPDNDTPGGRLWHARSALNLSIEDVALCLGISCEAVSDWERDRSVPEGQPLAGLAEILCVSPAWLTAGLAGPGQTPLGTLTPTPTALEPLLADLARAKALQAETARLLAETGAAIESLERSLRGVLQGN